ncbi:MAG: DUF2520 domain-containing protein [Acidobacteria bacterium]|nr:DUF2520 domain-containing protein [Acidobacteriota bacterium]
MPSASSLPPLAIAGTGRVAQALGRLLATHGWTIAAIAGRDRERAGQAARFIGAGVEVVSFAELPNYASHLLFPVADDAIEAVARDVAAGCIALHTSGLHGVAPLAVLERAGCACGSMHPLQTVPSPEQGVESLPGAWFAISGDAPASRFAEALVRSIGAKYFHVAGAARPVYHAAAVLASNYVVALVDAAVILMERAGVRTEDARPALTPLLMASVENALRMGPEKALTGPIRRGDKGTLEMHLEALDIAHPGIARLYRELGRHTIDLAVRAGLPPGTAGKLEMILSEDRHQESNG